MEGVDAWLVKRGGTAYRSECGILQPAWAEAGDRRDTTNDEPPARDAMGWDDSSVSCNDGTGNDARLLLLILILAHTRHVLVSASVN
jgi:hypothetical protein